MCGLNCDNNDVTTDCSLVTDDHESNNIITINITITEDLVIEGFLQLCCELQKSLI